MRVGPYGIISIKQRMDDLRDRYLTRNKIGFSADDIDQREQMLKSIETEIFYNSNIKAGGVSDETTEQIKKDISTWNI